MTVQSLIIQPPKNLAEQQEITELQSSVTSTDKIVIMTSDGQQKQVPLVVTQALIEMLNILSKGDSITLIPMDKELTTQQSADILNVSRPYFIKLLENGEIPFRKTGTHRKILMKDLIEYREKRNAIKKAKLSELAEISQELGLYD